MLQSGEGIVRGTRKVISVARRRSICVLEQSSTSRCCGGWSDVTKAICRVKGSHFHPCNRAYGSGQRQLRCQGQILMDIAETVIRLLVSR